MKRQPSPGPEGETERQITAPIEWVTLALAGLIHAAWVAVVVGHDTLTPWGTVAALAVVIAWHGSFQHEVLHGHPFQKQALNDLVGSAPFAVRLPYPLYKRDHLAHHRDQLLTDPELDTESFYVDADRWAGSSRLWRGFVLMHQCLVGRLLVGPIVMNYIVIRGQVREAREGNRTVLRWWLGHAVAVAVMLWLVIGVAGVSAWVYLLGAYLGHSIGLIRSYCEHRWVEGEVSRSAVVRSGPVFSLLFLNNNLHHAHHALPGAAWYRLPALADELGSDDAARAGAGHYRGYREVFRRFLFRPFDHPVHPLERARAGVG